MPKTNIFGHTVYCWLIEDTLRDVELGRYEAAYSSGALTQYAEEVGVVSAKAMRAIYDAYEVGDITITRLDG